MIHHMRPVVGGLVLAVALSWAGFTYGPRLADAAGAYFIPERRAMMTALRELQASDFDAGYALRGYRPIWLADGRLQPVAHAFLQQVAASAADGLDPRRYDAPLLAKRVANPGTSWAERAQTDILFTRSYVRFAQDLRTPLPGARMVFADPALRGPGRPAAEYLLDVLATARSSRAALQWATRMNPLYDRYRQTIAESLTRNDVDDQRLLLVNLERMRALPVSLGRRFILVNAARAQLWMYEDGRPIGSMKVVVGKPDEATPMLAGVIRYAIFNPHWNVPPDLVQNVYAPRILADRTTLDALKMEPWTSYTENGRKLDPATIDWTSVQAGARQVGLRQRPGPWNFMGKVKFMLPNELGIYLHDTPEKALFNQTRRTLSAGCVRVEDYKRLARWLYLGRDVAPKDDGPDRRVDLDAAVPVYITYLTAWPDAGRVSTAADVYRRDVALSKQMRAAHTSALAAVAAH